MKKTQSLIVEVSLTFVVTLTMFVILNNFHLVHTLSFVFPVPIAVLVYRNRLRDGIIPAIVLIVAATLISTYFPQNSTNDYSFLRGLLVMTFSMIVGLLHA